MIDVGVIGAGHRAQGHLDTLSAIDDVNIVAVCDVDETTANRAAETYEAKQFTDHEAMFETTSLDAALLVVPPFAHSTQEQMAVERDIDLFIEKPLGLSMESATEINEMIQESGIITSVGYQLRHDDAVEQALEYCDGRTIGLVEAYYKTGVPGGPGHWWQSREKSGGQVVEMATHGYDFLRLFGGEPRWVSALGENGIVDEIDFEDVVSSNVKLSGGTIGRVISTSAARRHATGVEIIGEGVHLHLSGNRLRGDVDGEQVEMTGENDSTADAIETFIEAVRTGDPSDIRVPYEEALKTFELTLAVEESLATGERVTLGEVLPHAT